MHAIFTSLKDPLLCFSCLNVVFLPNYYTNQIKNATIPKNIRFASAEVQHKAEKTKIYSSYNSSLLSVLFFYFVSSISIPVWYLHISSVTFDPWLPRPWSVLQPPLRLRSHFVVSI